MKKPPARSILHHSGRSLCKREGEWQKKRAQIRDRDYALAVAASNHDRQIMITAKSIPSKSSPFSN